KSSTRLRRDSRSATGRSTRCACRSQISILSSALLRHRSQSVSRRAPNHEPAVSRGEVDMPGTRAFVAGGAGFIGSHLVEALLGRSNGHVVVYDNLTSGTKSHLRSVLGHARLHLVIRDIE